MIVHPVSGVRGWSTRILLCIALGFGCAAPARPATTVLPYSSFGPQAMSYEALGFEWWQWQPHGDSRPREDTGLRQYDVRVVVYCDTSAEDVGRLYPVDRSAEQDYRYITYDRALNYLDHNIRQDFDPELTEQLRATRKEIVARLPSCHE
jgi:hypothetical protein